MKNITVSMDDEVARWTRVKAAEQETSVSRYIGELLRERMQREQQYQLAMQRYLARAPRPISGGKPYPKRDELYDRQGLR